MKDLFKHASSSWVKYDRYEWKKDKNNKFYITPAPNAMPKIYDPLKEYQQMVLDALNVGLMIRTSSKRKIREAIMEFVTKYGLLGLMTALPTTPSFIDYKAVYLPTNHFLREEVMDTQKYLFYFFPFEKPDFFKNGKDSLWNINGDRTMIALAMTFRKEPEAQVMCFMRNYAERYDWLEQTFQDWSFTFLSSFLFYEEDEEMDEDTRDIYRQGMAAFGGHRAELPHRVMGASHHRVGFSFSAAGNPDDVQLHAGRRNLQPAAVQILHESILCKER